MSWFESNKYPTKEYYITTDRLRELCSWAGLDSLTQKESRLVFKTLIKARGNDGHISLHRIYQELKELKSKHSISKFDLKALMARFEKFVNI